MTHDEFMEEAKQKINDILINERNEFLSLIDKTWEEGKKSAETEAIESKANDILEMLRKQISEAHVWTGDKFDNIPEGCRHCSNHPSNGGSGICHCIIGTQPIMCNSTANDICDAIMKDKMSDLAVSIAPDIGNVRDLKVYNAACDNHIKIIHDMMTGVKKDGENN
ncbi:MAG: hypothetical protein LIR46_02905 [Bacteroidota bacterium]|nr:hypothetical protein [Bacteroidota bacterium]